MNEELAKAVALVTKIYLGTYVQELFDPIQTHGIYGLTDATLPSVKEMLKKAGAKRFRTVKVTQGVHRILCFKA